MKGRRYGGGSSVGDRYVEDDRDWAEWFLGPMSEEVRASPASPVEMAEWGMLVR